MGIFHVTVLPVSVYKNTPLIPWPEHRAPKLSAYQDAQGCWWNRLACSLETHWHFGREVNRDVGRETTRCLVQGRKCVLRQLGVSDAEGNRQGHLS